MSRTLGSASERHVVHQYGIAHYKGFMFAIGGLLFVGCVVGHYADRRSIVIAVGTFAIATALVIVPRIIAEFKAPRRLVIREGMLTLEWPDRSELVNVSVLKVYPATTLDRMTLPPSIRLDIEGRQCRVFADISDYDGLVKDLEDKGAQVAL